MVARVSPPSAPMVGSWFFSFTMLVIRSLDTRPDREISVEFRMPSRGLFGYRNQFLTDTHGEGIINQIFDGYDVWAGMIANRSTGSLVSFETGEAVTYGLFNAQQRGTLLVGAGEKVYEGMVIGYTASGEDVDVNVCKTKHLTNTRASGSDDALRLIPISKLSLEGCLEFLAQDELLDDSRKELALQFCTAYSAILSRNNVIAVSRVHRTRN